MFEFCFFLLLLSFFAFLFCFTLIFFLIFFLFFWFFVLFNTPLQLTCSTSELPCLLLSNVVGILTNILPCHTDAECCVSLFTQVRWFLLTEKLSIVATILLCLCNVEDSPCCLALLLFTSSLFPIPLPYLPSLCPC